MAVEKTNNQAGYSGREFNFTEADFNKIRKIVHDKVGISIAPHKINMVYSRISRRLRALGLRNFQEYINLILKEENADEIVDFTNAITTNLTKFFREEHHFTNLEQNTLPKIFDRNASIKRLRIWSAGCSSGMEPYSIAMTLQHYVEKNNIRGWDIKILATDIDTNMLQTGKDGRYKAEEAENIPKRYSSYFSRDSKEKEIIMSDKVKNLISFKKLNLIERWPMKGPFDVIFCRNVVIYFDKDTRKQIFNNFASILAEEGFLYIGHSENLHEVSNRFEQTFRTTYRKVR